MEQAGYRQDWLAYLQAAHELGQLQNDTATLAEVAFQIGLLYRMLSQYDEAMRWLTSSLQSFQQLVDKNGQARVLNEMAWVEHVRRHYDRSTHYVEQAIALIDADAPEWGMSYRVKGMIAIFHGEWQQAEQHHRAALASFEQQGDRRKMAWSMVNIGYALRGQKQFDKAIHTLTEASSLLQELGDNYHWAIAQMNLGVAYSHLGEFDKSIYCYLTAESIGHKIQDRVRIADANLNLGLVYMAKGENVKASLAFQEAIRLNEELGIESMVVNCMDGLAMSYIAQERFNEALIVLEKALAKLPQIVNVPNHAYYKESLERHWQEAKMKQSLSFKIEADVA